MSDAKKPKSASKLQQHIAELTEALQRERADAENIRRRHEQQITGLRNTVRADVIEQLLPIIDNFELALKHVPADLIENPYVKGVEGVVKQFEKTLADIGVERIPTVGTEFNPHLHEAVAMEEGKGHKHIISKELRAGYTLGESVLRPAMVNVKVQ